MKKIFSMKKKTNGKEVVVCKIVTEKGKTFSGKASTSPQDEFILDIGIRMAETRAMDKYYKAEYEAKLQTIAEAEYKLQVMQNELYDLDNLRHDEYEKNFPCL